MGVNSRQLNTLSAFRPYFQLMNAFNKENLTGDNRSPRRIFEAIAIAISEVALIIVTALSFRRLMDVHFEINVFTTASPIIISMVQASLTFFVVIMKSRTIGATLQRLQATISKRKKSFLYIFHPLPSPWSQHASFHRNHVA